MIRKDSPEFKSLVDLLDDNSPAKNLTREEKIKVHPRNLLKIRCGSWTGSGYLLTGDGYFVTNYHVLPEESAAVYINHISFPFLLERTLIRSKPHDLIIGKIQLGSGCPPSVILAKQRIMIDEKIRTYSYSKDKAVRSEGVTVCRENYLDFFKELFKQNLFKQNKPLESRVKEHTQYSTCTVYPGWSGGPVVSEDTGELVGITNSITAFSNLYGTERYEYHTFSSAAILRIMIRYYLDGQI